MAIIWGSDPTAIGGPDTSSIVVLMGVTEFEPSLTTYAVHGAAVAARAVDPLNPASPAASVPRATPTVNTRRRAVTISPFARRARSIASIAPTMGDTRRPIDADGSRSWHRPLTAQIIEVPPPENHRMPATAPVAVCCPNCWK